MAALPRGETETEGCQRAKRAERAPYRQGSPGGYRPAPTVRDGRGEREMAASAKLDNAAFAPGLRHIESLPLGEAVILHNRESGAIVASNAFGALLLDALRLASAADRAVTEVAARLAVPEAEVRPAVEASLAQWQADGLFLEARQPFPTPVPYRPAEIDAPRAFALGPQRVVLACEDADLDADLARALAPLGLVETGLGETSVPGGSPPVRLDAIKYGPGYGLFRDAAPVWGAAGYELTRFHLLREIMDALLDPARIAAQLHASAVAVGGRALVFAGASGSGKSTLATMLRATGAALAADDHVALATEGPAILAFATRANLKTGAPELSDFNTIDGAGAGQGDRADPARVPTGGRLPLAGLVFPHYAPDGDNARTEIAPEEALRTLIQTGSRVSRHTRSIAPLVKALRAVPLVRLSYRDNAFAVAQCRALLGA